MKRLSKGQRVRFNTNQLGAYNTYNGEPAKEVDDLGHVVTETFGEGDRGMAAFAHPNQKMCKGWWFIEVESRAAPGTKLYVGVSPRMVEVDAS